MQEDEDAVVGGGSTTPGRLAVGSLVWCWLAGCVSGSSGTGSWNRTTNSKQSAHVEPTACDDVLVLYHYEL